MLLCPICETQYQYDSQLCNNCGWDLTPYPLTLSGIPEAYLAKERTKIQWARQQWIKAQELEHYNKDNEESNPNEVRQRKSS